MTYEILALRGGHPLWNAAADYADACPWRGGAHLAARMRSGRFHGRERVFILREDTEIIGFCTLTEKDELPPAYDFTPFIGSVFVDAAKRGQRLSERLIRAAVSYARALCFPAVYVMSGEQGLYEKYGFTALGMYPTVFGNEEQLFVFELP